MERPAGGFVPINMPAAERPGFARIAAFRYPGLFAPGQKCPKPVREGVWEVESQGV